jgi:phage terminase large subunit-like protein
MDPSRYGELTAPIPPIPKSTDDCPVPICPDEYGFGAAAVDALAAYSLSDGVGAGKAITREVLLEWQTRLLTWIFGFCDPVGSRRLREIGLELPRKNTKTKFAAFVAWLWALSPKGNAKKMQILLIAETVPLARTLFASIRDLISTNPEVLKRCRLRDHVSQIDFAHPSGVLVEIFVRSGPDAAQSLNPNLVIIDEIHLIGESNLEKGQRLLAGVRTSQGAQPGALRLLLSTPPTSASSYRPGTVYHDWNCRGTQLINGEIIAPQEMFIRYSAPDHLPWDSREAAEAANPGMAVGLSRWEEFEMEINRAKESGSSLQVDAYQALRLARTSHFKDSITNWLPGNELERARSKFTIDAIIDCRYTSWGVDLGSRDDWSSAVLTGLGDQGEIYMMQQSWVTRAAMSRHGDKGNWSKFVENGSLIITDQDSVAYDYILDYIIETAAATGVRLVGLDPAYATTIAASLEEEFGADSTAFVRQGPLSFSPLIEAIEQSSSAGKLHIFDDEALEFAFKNATIENRGLARMLSKDSRQPHLKIDPLIAGCNGLAVCLANRLVKAKNPEVEIQFLGAF